jgi:hypothetical protein
MLYIPSSLEMQVQPKEHLYLKPGVPALGNTPSSIGEHPTPPCARGMSISMGTSTVRDRLFTPFLLVERIFAGFKLISYNSVHFAMPNVYSCDMWQKHDSNIYELKNKINKNISRHGLVDLDISNKL